MSGNIGSILRLRGTTILSIGIILIPSMPLDAQPRVLVLKNELRQYIGPALTIAKMPCAATLATPLGQALRTGDRMTFDLVDRARAFGRAKYLPGDTKVTFPIEIGPPVHQQPPRVTKVLLTTKIIKLPADRKFMPGGWFKGGVRIAVISVGFARK